MPKIKSKESHVEGFGPLLIEFHKMKAAKIDHDVLSRQIVDKFGGTDYCFEGFSTISRYPESEYYETREIMLNDTIQSLVTQFELSHFHHIELLCRNLIHMYTTQHHFINVICSHDKMIYPPPMYNLHKLEQIIVKPSNPHYHMINILKHTVSSYVDKSATFFGPGGVRTISNQNKKYQLYDPTEGEKYCVLINHLIELLSAEYPNNILTHNQLFSLVQLLN